MPGATDGEVDTVFGALEVDGCEAFPVVDRTGRRARRDLLTPKELHYARAWEIRQRDRWHWLCRACDEVRRTLGIDGLQGEADRRQDDINRGNDPWQKTENRG